ncbi:MAG: hypothetical protein ACRD3D_01500 [Terriglobia bacterium]
MAVTGLQIVVNLRNQEITFTNTESDVNERIIGPKTSASVKNAWIPWCVNKGEFPQHHFHVYSGGDMNWYLWQRQGNDGDHVRFSRTGYEEPGTPVAGDPATGQDVLLVVLPDGALFLTKYLA